MVTGIDTFKIDSTDFIIQRIRKNNLTSNSLGTSINIFVKNEESKL